MSRFLKIVFGSCLGTLLALLGLFFFFSALIGASIGKAAAGNTPSVEANSVLELKFPGPVNELPNNVEPTAFSFSTDRVLGLQEILRLIERAAEDDDIKGIHIPGGSVPASFTTVRQIRQALIEFKESGKFITAYAPFYEQSGYYLASVADEVYVGPLGVIDYRGLGAEIPFFKPLMDKLGVKAEVFYAGDFKSATEPFRRDGISPENRLQTREFLGDIFSIMVADLDASRTLNGTDYRAAANNMTGWEDDKALATNMIDGILRQNEMIERHRSLLGLEDDDDEIETINSNDYFAARLKPNGFDVGSGGDQVAVLIAEGGIVDGDGEIKEIGDNEYVELINDLAEDDDVKALVLRVNSGGGSASSSENIWYALEQFKATGKPFVVSMGDVAASGGYYIAAGADSIFAEPSTITGSIGVFTLFPNAKELMEDRVGINFDTVNTTRSANALSPFLGVDQQARDILTRRTESVYEQFMQRVADGRGIPMDQVREIARGRVYSGVEAKRIELVDRLASLETAVTSAKSLTGLEDADDLAVRIYPKKKSVFEQLLADLTGEDPFATKVSDDLLRGQLGDEAFEHYRVFRDLSRNSGPQARMTLVVNF